MSVRVLACARAFERFAMPLKLRVACYAGYHRQIMGDLVHAVALSSSCGRVSGQQPNLSVRERRRQDDHHLPVVVRAHTLHSLGPNLKLHLPFMSKRAWSLLTTGPLSIRESVHITALLPCPEWWRRGAKSPPASHFCASSRR